MLPLSFDKQGWTIVLSGILLIIFGISGVLIGIINPKVEPLATILALIFVIEFGSLFVLIISILESEEDEDE